MAAGCLIVMWWDCGLFALPQWFFLLTSLLLNPVWTRLAASMVRQMVWWLTAAKLGHLNKFTKPQVKHKLLVCPRRQKSVICPTLTPNLSRIELNAPFCPAIQLNGATDHLEIYSVNINQFIFWLYAMLCSDIYIFRSMVTIRRSASQGLNVSVLLHTWFKLRGISRFWQNVMKSSRDYSFISYDFMVGTEASV